MSWEFLLGLLLPAYGVGYVWLIKTAREDPALYAALEKALRVALVIVFVASFVIAFWANGNVALIETASRNILFFSGLLMFLCAGILMSLKLFRRITTLPPKELAKSEISASPESPQEERPQ